MDQDVDLRAQLAREMSAAQAPPLASMVNDALAIGVRLRRRRRWAVIGSGVAVFAVVAAAGVTFAANPWSGGSGGTVTAGASTGTPVEATKPTTGRAVLALLTELLPLPAGELTEVEGSTAAASASGGLVYDDGQGKATVSAMVATAPRNDDLPCPADLDSYRCEAGTLPDGSQVRTTTMGPYETDCDDTKCSLKSVRVELSRPDGVSVTVEAYSGPFGMGRGATRADTLLTPAQLLTLAQDPRWGMTMAASFVDDAEQRLSSATVYSGG